MNLPLLLSAAQGADPGTAGLFELLKYGILGIFCVLLIIGLVWVAKAWRAAMDQRVLDAQAYGTALKDINDASTKVSNEIKSSVDSLEKSCNDLKSANSTEHGQQSTCSTDLTKAINDLREKQVEFIAEAKALKTAGGNG